MGIGEPACDLVISWTFLQNKSRQIFKDCLGLDADAWARAHGWALWKADFELVGIENKKSTAAIRQQRIINDILDENEN